MGGQKNNRVVRVRASEFIQCLCGIIQSPYGDCEVYINTDKHLIVASKVPLTGDMADKIAKEQKEPQKPARKTKGDVISFPVKK